ncbi:hypothetical protein DFS33DRAFT_1297133 [Desarmillaria ectypa]|nr:hypothetical protein DFS33DRAFT_1297133 [Desarmillaria ectypa]
MHLIPVPIMDAVRWVAQLRNQIEQQNSLNRQWRRIGHKPCPATSYSLWMPEDVKSKVLDGVIVERGDDQVWIDKSQGTFEYPHQTFLVISEMY